MKPPCLFTLAAALLVAGAPSPSTRAQADDCRLGIIVTVAGDGWCDEAGGYTGWGRFRGDGGLATDASLSWPSSVAMAPDGSVYIADWGNRRLRKFTPEGAIETVAGGPAAPCRYDGGLATEARLSEVHDVAVGADGSIYIADTGNNRIAKLDPGGAITTVAGTCRAGRSNAGYSGDGGPAAEAMLHGPTGVATAPEGTLYIADTANHRIRKVSPDGVITTVAGDGWSDQAGMGRFSGDGGPAAQASLNWPSGVAVAADGSVFIADTYNHRIRRIDPGGVITTAAGSGGPGYSGDSGPASEAGLHAPSGVAVGEDGRLYIADKDNHRVRCVDRAGIITTLAGTGDRRYSGDGGPAVEAGLSVCSAVAVGADGSLYIADKESHRIRKVQAVEGRVGAGSTIITVAGDGRRDGDGRGRFGGDGGPASQASLNRPSGLALGADGSLYIADQRNLRVRRVRPTDDRVDPAGTIETVAGGGRQCRAYGGAAVEADLDGVAGVAIAVDGSVYIADGVSRVAKIDPAGAITTIAGTCEVGYSGDGGPATEAKLDGPCAVAVTAEGSIYIADTWNHRIRMVDPDGIIATVAGDGWRDDNGRGRYSGDGGAAALASLNEPGGVAIGAEGSIYIADTWNHRIRRLDLDGIITTVAGSGERGWSGDGGPAVNASLDHPCDMALAADGSLYVVDTYSDRICWIDPAGAIATVAGSGPVTPYGAYSGDGGLATECKFRAPWGLALDADENIYIADCRNHRIRRVRWFPCQPQAAKAAADALSAEAGDSPTVWREVVEVYLIAAAWDDALQATERLLAVAPEGDESARMRARVLAARAYTGTRDDHEARRRLIPVLARSEDPHLLREAAEMLVDLYLRRGERHQAIDTLTDLRLRTRDWGLLQWIERRLREIAGD